MSKLLSQEEIDALLSADLGEAKQEPKEEKEYRLYDFRRADRVSKEQQRFLRNIHENFAKLLSTFLSNKLRTMIDVKSPIIDQVTYMEFTMSSSEYTHLYIFEVEKLDGKGLLEIDPNFTNFVIDKLFGGPGQIIKRGNQTTVIEESVMMSIVRQIMKSFEEAWIHEGLKPEITDFETNPQLVTIAPPSETIIILNFPITARNYDFYLYLCFPYFMMEPVLKKLITDSYMSLLKKKISETDRENLEQNIIASDVDFIVELGRTNIEIEEFLELKKNDIIILDNRTTDLSTARVNEKSKFVGKIGKSSKHYSYKIEHFLDEEGEIIHE